MSANDVGKDPRCPAESVETLTADLERLIPRRRPPAHLGAAATDVCVIETDEEENGDHDGEAASAARARGGGGGGAPMVSEVRVSRLQGPRHWAWVVRRCRGAGEKSRKASSSQTATRTTRSLSKGLRMPGPQVPGQAHGMSEMVKGLPS